MPSENFPVPAGYKLLVKGVTLVASLFLRLLFFTCKIEYFGEKEEQEIRRRHGAVTYATWHRNLIYNMYHGRRSKKTPYNPSCMASRSKDGEWAAGLLKWFGFVSPRGSSNRHGKQALKEIVWLAKKGYDSALTCDASQGPAQRCKIGSLVIAAKSGLPIIASVSSAYPCWRPATWDGTIIPKPFSRVVIAMDKTPIFVPADADRRQMEDLRKKLEDRLNILAYQVDMYVMNPKTYADPWSVPVPKNYLEDNWDPFRFSVARM